MNQGVFIHHPVCLRALEHYGEESQIAKAREELLELALELSREPHRRDPERIASEIADVENMLDQLRWIYGDPLVDGLKAFKIDRLEKRIG